MSDLLLIIISMIVVLCVIGLFMYSRYSIPRLVGHLPFTVLILGSTIGFCIVCLVILFRRFNVRYIINNDGVQAIRGILSNHQVDAKLEYYQIRGTEIHRSLFERLVGTGDLHVRGSTSKDTEVSFKGIYDPYRYQKLIQEQHRLKVADQNFNFIDRPTNMNETFAEASQ